MSNKRILILLSVCAAVCVSNAWAGRVTVQSGSHRVSVEEHTGNDLRYEFLSEGENPVVTGSVGWELFAKQGKVLASSDVKCQAYRSDDQVTLRWTKSKISTKVELKLHAEFGLGMRITVKNDSPETITEILFPAGVSIDQRKYEELIVGDHIGVALNMDRWFEQGGSLGDGIPYPCAHADILVAGGKDKQPSLGFACPHTEEFLTPSAVLYGKTGDHIGSFSHRFIVWIPRGKTWTSPYIYAFNAKDVFDAFATYRKMLGLDKAKTLQEKWGKNFDAASKSVVLKYECAWYGGKTIREFANMTKDLPSPLIYQPVEYWPVRFDDHYPDYFPINENLGTNEDFRKMIETAHARGDLVMPFFSPAHWSIGSPSTEKVGEQVAARDENNQPYMYDGRPNYGLNYYVTGWNKHVTDKAAENLRDFREFGCDAAFADIVGNMNKPFDLNPASPNPRAFFAGMIHLGDVMAKEQLTLTTEGGNDVHSRNFAGMFQFFLKVKYKFIPNRPWQEGDGYAEGWLNQPGKTNVVRLFPMNTAIASGLSMIYSHNLGAPIIEQEMLNDCLAMGMGLYLRYEDVDKGHMDWLNYLHYLQQEIVRHYFGQPMTGFEYVKGFDEVSVTRWTGMDLYVNHTPKVQTVEMEGNKRELKPFGMIRVLKGEAREILAFKEWEKGYKKHE